MTTRRRALGWAATLRGCAQSMKVLALDLESIAAEIELDAMQLKNTQEVPVQTREVDPDAKTPVDLHRKKP